MVDIIRFKCAGAIKTLERLTRGGGGNLTIDICFF